MTGSVRDSGMQITNTTGVRNAAPVDKTEPKRPAKDAKKAEWEGYARETGVAVPDDATKADIIALVDQHEG